MNKILKQIINKKKKEEQLTKFIHRLLYSFQKVIPLTIKHKNMFKYFKMIIEMKKGLKKVCLIKNLYLKTSNYIDKVIDINQIFKNFILI